MTTTPKKPWPFYAAAQAPTGPLAPATAASAAPSVPVHAPILPTITAGLPVGHEATMFHNGTKMYYHVRVVGVGSLNHDNHDY